MIERHFEPKPGWSSVTDNLVDDFYRPALNECVKYDRLTGFFDSNTFATVFQEAMTFVERGGRMRLITSATFSSEDLEIIKKSVDDKLLDDVSIMMDDDVGKKCLSLFAHMLTNTIDGKPQLDIRILVPQRGIFHAKVGIFNMKNGDIISFSGSINETGMGWTGNVEEFKAFCSWVDRKYVDVDIDRFNNYWSGTHRDIRSFSLPQAVQEKILTVRPESDTEYKKLLLELKKQLRVNDVSKKPKKFELWEYQKEAIDAWVSKGYKGILEMPTATGKTFTALGCINKLKNKQKRLFTVIAVPYQHLKQQWVDKIKEWNEIVLPGQRLHSNVISMKHGWKSELQQAVVQFSKTFDGRHVGNDYIICVTYDILAKPDFTKAINDVKGELLLVADEAHHTGAPTFRKGLLEAYSSRLALSATPERYFDEGGSNLIQKYFGGKAYSMEIGYAIKNGYLSQYEYHPVFAHLTMDESKRYRRLTNAIAIEYAKECPLKEEIQQLQNKRAKIVSVAEQKHLELTKILKLHTGNLENAIIYCHDKKQLKKVEKILSKHNIIHDVIDNSTDMLERRVRIESLAEKNHQCIVAMKCLDEGVDIPSAQLGIIMASTGNPLQYIQRRGRFLRKSKNKKYAVIYDILVDVTESDREHSFARKLVAKELLRHKDFAENARNKSEALDVVRPVADKLGIDVEKLDIKYMLGL